MGHTSLLCFLVHLHLQQTVYIVPRGSVYLEWIQCMYPRAPGRLACLTENTPGPFQPDIIDWFIIACIDLHGLFIASS